MQARDKARGQAQRMTGRFLMRGSEITASCYRARYYDSNSGRFLGTKGTDVTFSRFAKRDLSVDVKATPSYYRARYYDPSSGRFLGEDPLRFNAGINFLAYVGNRPALYRDSMGMKFDPWNNALMDWLSRNADWLPGACEGGGFAWGGVQGAGKKGAAGYALGEYGYSPNKGWHSDTGGFLPEAFGQVRGTEVGGGVVLPGGELIGYALPWEGPIAGGGHWATGPVVAVNLSNYDGISIGWVGDISGPSRQGTQLNAGVGVYLTFTNASSCLKKYVCSQK